MSSDATDSEGYTPGSSLTGCIWLAASLFWYSVGMALGTFLIRKGRYNLGTSLSLPDGMPLIVALLLTGAVVLCVRTRVKHRVESGSQPDRPAGRSTRLPSITRICQWYIAGHVTLLTIGTLAGIVSLEPVGALELTIIRSYLMFQISLGVVTVIMFVQATRLLNRY